MQRTASSSEGPPGVGNPGRRTWQKIGWLPLALFVLTGSLGVFGNGPLNRASEQDGSLRVDYDRVLRLHAQTELRVAVARKSPRPVELAVLAGDPLDFELDRLAPEPLRQRVTPQGLVYEIDSDGGPIRIALRGVPLQVGCSEIRLVVDGRESVSVRQLVLP